MKAIIRRIFFWLCTLLAVGVAVLAIRSFWRSNEIGYYTYNPVPGQPGLDCRQLIGSWRGGLFWLSTQADVNPKAVDWCGGDPTEIIVRHTAHLQLATAALESANTHGLHPHPHLPLGGFNFGTDSGMLPATGVTPSRRWSYCFVVVPCWVPLLLLALPAITAVRRRWIRHRRRKHGLCPNCGYDLRASGPRCSECGELRPELMPPQPPLPRTRRWPIAITCGVLLASVAAFWLTLQRGERVERPVRLDRATVLSADHLPQRVELDLGKGVTMQFALIPAGRFLMGSPPDEEGRCDDETQHEVVISRPFYMGVTPVTQEQYEAVMGNNPSKFKGPKNPVENVPWADANTFWYAVKRNTGREVRLPTEAQWEYACRAGTTTAFNTGRTLPRDMANYGIGWTYPSNRVSNPVWQTLPVGSFPPNAWGLYDMHGNIWQWCSDWYGIYPKAKVTDPEKADGASWRALRGGSWDYGAWACRCAYRHGSIFSDIRNDTIGFRVVLVTD